MSSPDRDPGILVWLLGAISLALPFLAVPLIAAGIWSLAYGDRAGLAFAAGGLALFALDFLIDVVWAAAISGASDQPNLNQRGHHYIGSRASVAEAIVDGRGKVRVGNSLWLAEGPDCVAGTLVTIVGTNGTVLAVAPVPPAPSEPAATAR